MIYAPPGTFISRYMEMMEEQETPRIYDFMCACWVLSNALGRSFIVDRPRAPVHLNMYTILISDSGIMRKSTSIRIATKLLREFYSATNNTTLLFESRVSAGILLDQLSAATREHQHAHGVLVASELAAVLGRGSTSSGMPALLTDLYDCPDTRVGGGSLHTGTFNLSNVCFSFLGGSTPAWLASGVAPGLVEGGFTSRCYFVRGVTRKRSIAWADGEHDVGTDGFVKLLSDVRREGIPFSRIGIRDTARRRFTNWYNGRSLHKDAYRESFESREDAHVLKFAGLFAANERAWEILESHIERAINVVADLKSTGSHVFTTTEVDKYDAKLLAKLRNTLLAVGAAGIKRGELLAAMKVSGRHTDDVRSMITVMHELGLIEVYEKTNTRGRPSHTYVATEYLKNEQMLEDVARKLGMD